MMQLLAVGKSFRPGKTSRYELADKPLPKFADVGRPISLAPSGETETAQPDLFANAPATITATADAPAVAPAPAQREAARKSLFRMPTMGAARSPRPARDPQQAELALNAVRVVRNDLSDSDLELVAARPAPVTPPRKHAPMAPKPTWWQRLTGWLGMRKAGA
ncbi:MAG: hypothetical protein AB1705_26820 [Verrucomicrobiota bacterium]